MDDHLKKSNSTGPTASSADDRNGVCIFSYDKLPSASLYIRLLQLHPSILGPDELESSAVHHNSSLYGSIKTTPIDSPYPFKALSYTWGVFKFTHPIDIDGAQLLITESLDTALRHLRSKYQPLLIWIDQICINQQDDQEKTDQVRIMGQIYSAAEQVLVWLGPAEKNSDDAMDFYAEIGQAAFDMKLQDYYTPENFPVLHGILSDKNPDDPRWQELSAVIQKANASLIQCFQAIADWDKCPWMTRVWIIQEFCLGADPHFVRGSRRVPVDFVKFTRLIIIYGVSSQPKLSDDCQSLLSEIIMNDPSPPIFSARAQRLKFERGVGPGDTLLELLRKAYVQRPTQATDARDRVFGLLGLACDAEQLKQVGFQADYTKSRLQALTDAARAIIQCGNLEILSFVQFPKDNVDLPSWVPDWHPNLRPSFYPYPEQGEQHLFSPTGDVLPVVLPSADSKILGLTGFLVDTVEDVGSVFSDEGGDPLRHQEWLSQARFLCKISEMKNQPIYMSEQCRKEAVWRTPIADIYEAMSPKGARKGDSQTAKAFEDWNKTQDWFEAWKTTQSLEEFKRGVEALLPDEEPGIYRFSMAKMNGMRLYITQNGYVGMGTSLMCPGDVVVVFLGGRVCSVLRPKGRRGDKEVFFYQGEAYCDGVMDGELLGHRHESEFFLV